jgi:hypothetical protein
MKTALFKKENILLPKNKEDVRRINFIFSTPIWFMGIQLRLMVPLRFY